MGKGKEVVSNGAKKVSIVLHKVNANVIAKNHGGIKKVSKNQYGTQYTYGDGTGYWAEK